MISVIRRSPGKTVLPPPPELLELEALLPPSVPHGSFAHSFPVAPTHSGSHAVEQQ